MPTNLFGEQQETLVVAPQSLSPIQQMHTVYGVHSGKVCGTCFSFLRTGKNTTYFKCAKFGTSHGAGTDWRYHHKACGLYTE